VGAPVHPLIRLGLELPPLGGPAGPGGNPEGDLISVSGLLRRAEDSGLGTLWLGEGGSGGLDPVPLLGSLARACTLGLGLVVRPSGGRHPSLLARDVTTIDLLSDGRAAIALVEEGTSPGDLERLGEATAILRLLLTEHEVTVAGRFYEVAELTTRPRPPTPAGPPVAAGIIGPPIGRDSFAESVVVAASADAYVTGGGPHDVAICRRRLDQAAPAGRSPLLLWRGSVGPDDRAAAEITRSVLDSGADGLIAVLGRDAIVGDRLAGPAVTRAIEALRAHAARFGR
jgi:alkanesulfonate monooxygenase SsuD/methylene tetrahydromethanopterin reductase-like flavin-dependent oxidoreductase (luciferase family)